MSSESTEVWAGWYRDRAGAEAVAITATDGRVSTCVRGTAYAGATFAALRAGGTGAALTGCVLEWDMPLPVRADGVERAATLSCLLTLGEAAAEGGAPVRSELSLTLHYGGTAYEAAVADGDFDEALARIRRQLPSAAEPVLPEPART
ncbi:DUF6304 family protein [Streptomyces sp. C10-9-1]|uniref:DUF6304 family protein n=1 Tax=Streptomyces sp. C10-9-1 TaxID=1859285 RepID=UPI0021137D41|nr:DUF6304 family protein [Streptomyces sp. C10-9-1]MCQ6554332.1 DUF6304 family protein [Streptomyces sp. C10-9-1]